MKNKERIEELEKQVQLIQDMIATKFYESKITESIRDELKHASGKFQQGLITQNDFVEDVITLIKTGQGYSRIISITPPDKPCKCEHD